MFLSTALVLTHIVIIVQYNYYISNKGLLEEDDKQENVAVNWGCYCFLFQKKTVNLRLHTHTQIM